MSLYRNFVSAYVPPPEPPDDWEARCGCGWWGSREAGFAHAVRFRERVTFREPVEPLPEHLRPPRTVAEAFARSTVPPSSPDRAEAVLVSPHVGGEL